MTIQEQILRLMYVAFIDIRVASYDKDIHTIFALSNIFHNVPLHFFKALQGEDSFENVMKNIEYKCSEMNCMVWLDNAKKI